MKSEVANKWVRFGLHALAIFFVILVPVFVYDFFADSSYQKYDLLTSGAITYPAYTAYWITKLGTAKLKPILLLLAFASAVAFIIGADGVAIVLLVSLLAGWGIVWFATRPNLSFPRAVVRGGILLLTLCMAVIFINVLGMKYNFMGGGYYGLPVFGILVALGILCSGLLILLVATVRHFSNRRKPAAKH